MAGRPQNRLELRRQYEAAEPLDPVEDESDELAVETDEDEGERRPKKKKAPAKPKAKSSKPAKPTARMRVMWTVVNDAFKTVGTFEFAQKDAALARAAELTAKGKGTHFVQKVKEPMPENAPGIGAKIPRTATPPPTAAVVVAPPIVEVEEEDEILDDEDTLDEEPEEEEDDE